MEIKVDGTPSGSWAGKFSLAELLERVQHQLVPPGRVITSLKVNGREIGDLNLEDTSVWLDPEGLMEVQTGIPEELLKDGVREMRLFLPRLEHTLTHCATVLRRGEPDQQTYIQCIEGIGVLVEFAHVVGRMLEGEGRGRSPDLVPLHGSIRNLAEAQERDDRVLLADLLQYEIAPEVVRWHEYLVP